MIWPVCFWPAEVHILPRGLEGLAFEFVGGVFAFFVAWGRHGAHGRRPKLFRVFACVFSLMQRAVERSRCVFCFVSASARFGGRPTDGGSGGGDHKQSRWRPTDLIPALTSFVTIGKCFLCTCTDKTDCRFCFSDGLFSLSPREV